jgi:hypothetical protein
MKTNERGMIEVALRMMRPLIRMLMRHGVSYGDFAELARHAYVDVAQNDFQIPNRKLTTSRVAVVTGLSRKEVLRLLDTPVEGKTDERERSNFNRANRVVNGWLTDPEFRNAKGKPRSLTLKNEPGSFPALVKRYSGDITARAILDELISAGAVVKARNRTVQLQAEGYVPAKSDVAKVQIAATCVSDLLDTINLNLACAPDDARFQRQVTYHDLPQSVIDNYRSLSREKSNQLLVELNEWLAREKRESTAKKGEKRGRVGTGIYYFENIDNKVGE